MDSPIVTVTNKTKDKVLNFLYQNKFLNAYAIYRLENNIRESVTYAYIDANDCIDGYLSKFVAPDAIDVWFRASSSKVAIEFLNLLGKEISDLQRSKGKRRRLYVSSDLEFASIIKEKFPSGKFHPEYALMVKKGEEKSSESSIACRRLSEEDAEEFTKFWLEENEVLNQEWIEVSREYLRSGVYYGVFDSEGRGRRMLSSANALICLPYVWVISGVKTLAEYRKRGYASSILSRIISEAFQNTDRVMLFVNRDNAEAINVYEKLGFRKFAEFLEVIDDDEIIRTKEDH
jgi:RimJ/RimL family protein N-acetyltransferase